MIPTAGAIAVPLLAKNLATGTGGRYFQHVVNFVTPLSEVASETTGYYLLSYRATHPRGRSGYQKVKVTLRNFGRDRRYPIVNRFRDTGEPLPMPLRRIVFATSSSL